MYTGIHTVSPATLASPCERTNPPYLSIYLGAVFADMQPFSNAGAYHGSECKLLYCIHCFSTPGLPLICFMTPAPLPFHSAYSFRNIQQIDSNCRRSGAVSDPPDDICELRQGPSECVSGVQLARVRTWLAWGHGTSYTCQNCVPRKCVHGWFHWPRST